MIQAIIVHINKLAIVIGLHCILHLPMIHVIERIQTPLIDDHIGKASGFEGNYLPGKMLPPTWFI